MNQHVQDESDLRKYRTELPNMADDELDPYQYRLYAHYKRVCGANGGKCWESRETTVKVCHMSQGMVTKTRNWLAQNGWIRLERGNNQNDTYNITIIDRWAENMERYSRSSCGDDRSHTVTTGRHVVTQRSNSVKNKPKEEVKNNGVAANDTPPAPAAESPKLDTVTESVTPLLKEKVTEHPFIVAYREVFHRYPDKAQMAQLAKMIVTPPALERWVEACRAWLMAGYKPTNLAGIIDWYTNGHSGHSNGKVNTPSKKPETRTVNGVEQEKIGGTWYAKKSQRTA